MYEYELYYSNITLQNLQYYEQPVLFRCARLFFSTLWNGPKGLHSFIIVPKMRMWTEWTGWLRSGFFLILKAERYPSLKISKKLFPLITLLRRALRDSVIIWCFWTPLSDPYPSFCSDPHTPFSVLNPIPLFLFWPHTPFFCSDPHTPSFYSEPLLSPFLEAKRNTYRMLSASKTGCPLFHFVIHSL